MGLRDKFANLVKRINDHLEKLHSPEQDIVMRQGEKNKKIRTYPKPKKW